jgi:hypothetical protein
MVLSAALLLVGVSALFAQQDPDDPGMQDSLIFVCNPDHVDSTNTGQTCLVDIYAVTDDSIMYFNLPLRWYAPRGGLTAGPVQYFPPIGCGMFYDTVIASENYIRIFGFLDGSEQCPPLFTDSLRLLIISVWFIIAPNTPEQVVVFDTCWDDRNGSVAFIDESGEIEITPAIQRGFLSIGSVGIDPDNRIPGEFSLCQNYPNPFNASATIEYSLHYGGPVRLEVFDLLGRRVTTLVEGAQAAGEHEVIWEANDVPSGVYFYRLSADGFVETKRMLLLK